MKTKYFLLTIVLGFLCASCEKDIPCVPVPQDYILFFKFKDDAYREHLPAMYYHYFNWSEMRRVNDCEFRAWRSREDSVQIQDGNNYLELNKGYLTPYPFALQIYGNNNKEQTSVILKQRWSDLTEWDWEGGALYFPPKDILSHDPYLEMWRIEWHEMCQLLGYSIAEELDGGFFIFPYGGTPNMDSVIFARMDSCYHIYIRAINKMIDEGTIHQYCKSTLK